MESDPGHDHGERGTKEEYTRAERSDGSFSRSLTIPPNLDWNKIQAGCKYGVLKLTLARTKQDQADTTKVAIE